VDDAGRVDGLEGLGDARGQLQHRTQREHTVLVHGGGEGGPGYVADGEPGLGAVGVTVQHRRGVGALHAAGGGDLLGEAPPELRVLRVLPPDDLERYRLPAPRVRQVHHPHAAFAQAPLKSVTGYLTGVVRRQVLHGCVPPRWHGLAMLRK
jgi:hypothetical protein